jgi:Chaperone of endosialidase
MGVNTLYQSTGNNNIAIGSGAGSSLTMGNNNIDIGNICVAGEANTIRIGSGNQTAAFIAGISGATVTGTGVVVSASGQLGTAPSSARFKEAIKPMDKASEAILALKPVTFRYKEEIDPDCIPQFGLVAEEVEKVNPDLVACDRDGKPYTVRYDAVNTMLLNEFLKQHRKVEEQEATIAQLKKNFHSKLAEQQKQIRALASGLEKLSAQLATASPSSGGLEASKFATGRIRSSGPAPQIVLNDQ